MLSTEIFLLVSQYDTGKRLSFINLAVYSTLLLFKCHYWNFYSHIVAYHHTLRCRANRRLTR